MGLLTLTTLPQHPPASGLREEQVIDHHRIGQILVLSHLLACKDPLHQPLQAVRQERLSFGMKEAPRLCDCCIRGQSSLMQREPTT